MNTSTHFFNHISIISQNEKCLLKYCRVNRNRHWVFSKIFWGKSSLSCHNVEKYCSVGQVTDVNIAHEHRMLDT